MVHAFTELGLLVFVQNVCVQHFQQHFSYILSQSSKWKFEFTGPKQILDLSLYTCTLVLNKNWKNLLVLGLRTGAHREDCPGIQLYQ
jgi:hypothetical protein